MVDLRQSQQYADYIKTLGWEVAKVGSIYIFIRKFGVFGAIAKIQRFTTPEDWSGVAKVLKKNKVWMTKIEPLSEMSLKGFKQDNWPMLASKTLRIDLKQSFALIQSGFKKDCRYILRKLEGLHQITFDEFENFYGIWKMSSKRKNLWMPSLNSYTNLIRCFGRNVFCITVDNQAGALVLIHNKIAYYYYAGATSEGSKNNLPYLVVLEALKKAKSEGCELWDFEGIYDARFPNREWKGFTHFKKSFGGYEVDFPGSFTHWL